MLIFFKFPQGQSYKSTKCCFIYKSQENSEKISESHRPWRCIFGKYFLKLTSKMSIWKNQLSNSTDQTIID